MAKYALPCIACGRQLENVEADAENQPYNGTAFVSHGHYGSTIFDPMDGHFLEINICDACLALHRDRVMEGRDRRPVKEGGVIVGFEDIEWKLTPWWPSKESIDHALGVLREHGNIDPPEPA